MPKSFHLGLERPLLRAWIVRVGTAICISSSVGASKDWIWACRESEERSGVASIAATVGDWSRKGTSLWSEAASQVVSRKGISLWSEAASQVVFLENSPYSLTALRTYLAESLVSGAKVIVIGRSLDRGWSWAWIRHQQKKRQVQCCWSGTVNCYCSWGVVEAVRCLESKGGLLLSEVVVSFGKYTEKQTRDDGGFGDLKKMYRKLKCRCRLWTFVTGMVSVGVGADGEKAVNKNKWVYDGK